VKNSFLRPKKRSALSEKTEAYNEKSKAHWGRELQVGGRR